ncbi:MAG TPA: VOC family protein [Devosiaceae bacterium]|jgi:predicted 3-demethylubiquinone-9 3-methyltransferase (glyoxalase superfamily)|nr:VOC family protein [Devosiaceae bacterium]
MHKITPFLWFDTEAEEAAEFYVSLFPNSRITGKTHYGEGAPGPKGQVMTVSFELDGLPVTALNGGPIYKFTEAVSFSVSCEDQAEVDRFWNALTANGGQEGPCAWLKDKYGFSWQIVPKALMRLLGDPDPKKSQAAMQAMLKMKKIIIADLEAAAAAA